MIYDSSCYRGWEPFDLDDGDRKKIQGWICARYMQIPYNVS